MLMCVGGVVVSEAREDVAGFWLRPWVDRTEVTWMLNYGVSFTVSFRTLSSLCTLLLHPVPPPKKLFG